VISVNPPGAGTSVCHAEGINVPVRAMYYITWKYTESSHRDRAAWGFPRFGFAATTLEKIPRNFGRGAREFLQLEISG
jgi:hypothetical protein